MNDIPNPEVNLYLQEGCGRCPLGGTPDCKVHSWTQELQRLRAIVLECGLIEEVKWGVPCYTFQQKNVLILSAFKAYCSISFFKGSLLSDPKGILVKPGPHSQAARLLKFTHLTEIEDLAADIPSYIFEAIEVERAGLKVAFTQHPEPIPEELEQAFAEDPVLKSAFEALTPGRQRGYILYFSAPKQSKTRISRIEKNTEKILSGVGLHDHYGRKK